MEKSRQIFDTKEYSKESGSEPKKGKALVKFPSDYVVIDIETTGLNPKKDEIIELSAMKFCKNTLYDSYSTLVKPKNKVNYFITKLTGITNEMLKDTFDIEQVLPEFLDFISDSIVIGHNVCFDINFINNYSTSILNRCFNNDFVDTVRMARLICPKLSSYKLSSLANHYGINSKGAHRGLKDCQMAQELLEKLKLENTKNNTATQIL